MIKQTSSFTLSAGRDSRSHDRFAETFVVQRGGVLDRLPHMRAGTVCITGAAFRSTTTPARIPRHIDRSVSGPRDGRASLSVGFSVWLGHRCSEQSPSSACQCQSVAASEKVWRHSAWSLKECQCDDAADCSSFHALIASFVCSLFYIGLLLTSH